MSSLNDRLPTSVTQTPLHSLPVERWSWETEEGGVVTRFVGCLLGVRFAFGPHPPSPHTEPTVPKAPPCHPTSKPAPSKKLQSRNTTRARGTMVELHTIKKHTPYGAISSHPKNQTLTSTSLIRLTFSTPKRPVFSNAKLPTHKNYLKLGSSK